MIINLRRAQSKHSRIKLHADVKRDSSEMFHKVVFIRTKDMKRWLCDCTDFMMRRVSRRRHCVHIKAVRAEAQRILSLKESSL
jgi:hypothetical protein